MIKYHMAFSTESLLSYNMSGKFIAQSDSWTHYTRELKDYEFMLVTEGTLYIENEISKYTVHKGEYLLMAPSKVQKGSKPSRCAFYWLHFSTTQKIDIPQQAFVPAPERIIIHLKQLQDSDSRYKNNNLNSLLTAAILTEIELQLNPQQTPQKNISQEHLLQSVKEYIKWNIHTSLKISDIAAYFGYNEKYLTTLFHETTGSPLKKYILQLKMEQAKIQLSETNNQVSQIAYKLGYDDPHNFSNAFKKITGLSPMEYRISCT